MKNMSARGIVNSICSKNDFEKAKNELVKHGIWDYFVFPKIAFAPKGAMVQEIIESAQLRAPSVLFIDDNVMNLNEALHYNPGLQIAEPAIIPGLNQDQRCKGKLDPEMTRLSQYKILEQKQSDRTKVGKDNREFLKQSGIRVSFHYDVMNEFPRIHDLVNRTNQLNFTKKRWPENEEEARAFYIKDLSEVFDSHSGYIKVSDRYGNYGICGFYVTRHKSCHHYLFSCRTLNMGIEQFVWHKLGQPYIGIVGEVVSSLEELPDWITVVDDADDETVEMSAASRPIICVRGACDLSMMTHYLRGKFNTIEEFQFPYEGWGIHPVARAIGLYEETLLPE
ncbi:MAG: phosphatase, partial [Acidocella sp. 20-61-6]